MVVSTDLENRCLTLLRIEIRDEGRVLTCSLKVRFKSKIIPRSLTDDTGIKCCPRKGTLMSGTLVKSCFVPKRISLVLSGLISNLFVQHQEAISRSSETLQGRSQCFPMNTKDKLLCRQHMTLHLKT